MCVSYACRTGCPWSLVHTMLAFFLLAPLDGVGAVSGEGHGRGVLIVRMTRWVVGLCRHRGVCVHKAWFVLGDCWTGCSSRQDFQLHCFPSVLYCSAINMVISLLELPTEILIGVFSSLSLRDLLHFSETSHYARFLTNANLHTLTLDFCSTPQPTKSRSYDSARRTQSPKRTSRSPRTIQAALDISKHLSKLPSKPQITPVNDLNRAAIHIPDATSYNYTTLTHFQAALTTSILTRHAVGLRHLDLSVWALSVPIANALVEITALQSLSITIAKCPYVRLVPRSCILNRREEEKKAWAVVARSETGFARLKNLKIGGAEVNVGDLLSILRGSTCKSLALAKCNVIGKELWDVMRKEWTGWNKLESLQLSECGGVLDDSVLVALGAMTKLRVSLCLISLLLHQTDG